MFELTWGQNLPGKASLRAKWWESSALFLSDCSSLSLSTFHRHLSQFAERHFNMTIIITMPRFFLLLLSCGWLSFCFWFLFLEVVSSREMWGLSFSSVLSQFLALQPVLLHTLHFTPVCTGVRFGDSKKRNAFFLVIEM